MIFSALSRGLRGEVSVPGDKSISHRSIILGAISEGLTEADGFLSGEDCLSTAACFRHMGISIEQKGTRLLIRGKGLRGLARPAQTLNCGNSGTTARLLSGLLSGQDFDSALTGDASIQKRPMKRVMTPLRRMGASIESEHGNDCAPLLIKGSPLHGISYKSPVASAQVKSAILLAGLYAEGETAVTEPFLSRDHSERMLRRFGADVKSQGNAAILSPGRTLTGQKLQIPGDISSAAFFIAAALTVPGSEILIRNVGINPTRDGILSVCRDMGASIELFNRSSDTEEPSADLLVRHTPLRGTVIEGALIPRLIDELPVIAAMACFAEGTTVIRDAAELKVKESNRIAAMTESLRAMGADVEETEDGMVIRGGRPLTGAVIDSRKDHRIAMTFAVAALAGSGQTTILDAECVNISYPDFYKDLESLCR